MFRFLARLLGLVVGISIVGGVASAIAARLFKKNAPPPPDPASDEIDLAVVMRGGELTSTASAFRGGRVICWYGGADVDLRNAVLDPAGARLEVRTAFGGTRIVVAPGVPVRVSNAAVFGGTSNAADAPLPMPGTPGLEITGFTVFGGLQVIAPEIGEEIPAWSGEHERRHDHEAGDDAGAGAAETQLAPA